MKLELRLSGSGGQGLILAGIILAEGAILSDLNAVQTQSYGPEARGGASKAEVIISNDSINFPKIIHPDILLALTKKSYNEYLKDVKKDGIIIVDSSVSVECTENLKTYKFPIINTSREVVGKEIATNMVALGIISELLPSVDNEKIMNSIKRRVPKGTEELNIKAFQGGIELFKNNTHSLHY
ncbi:2-oxoacid:ferredoxin oxidoreductase subunit gamma [Romboutsia maritimum]|uniref:2-oxoacid:ferredoxin oxidoreductase subunit gamma n=1 Tax=Romboutsia maritimum TaxID=2020948 RepID=A0A371IUY3_9FIRM|nr:2-oxoacid:acceptor oxidoreductase family protein [Romboutsia maritimum]RDY24293.1 2-oxoacid:ferredoxin oxidoreductase subunit gamma [Romboutsia maritimum]